jgi:hypothetical protein
MTAITVYCQRFLKTPYHTSILRGRAWVDELLGGHPDRIYDSLRVRKHVFISLVQFLRADGQVRDSKRVSLEEQVAIFLFICAADPGCRMAAERFQRSWDTINM